MNDLPLPILVTGIAGVAGYNAFAYFRAKYAGQVIGTRRKDLWRLDDDGIEACDAEDRDTLAKLFDKYKFRTVINTVGNCRLKHCELDPELAERLNVKAVENLLQVIADRDVRLVHLSIDLVFSGDKGNAGQYGYRETSPTDPVTVYGKTMVKGEALIRESMPAATILRISLPMGESFNGHAGAIDWIQSRFAAGKPATLYVDEVRTPTYTDCLNLALERVAQRQIVGTFHAGGPRALSLYEIAQVVNRVGGYNPDLLIGIPRAEAGPMPPRAGDVRMDSHALEIALGESPFDPWPLETRFVPTDAAWHYDRPVSELGSPRLLRDVLYRNPRRRTAESWPHGFRLPARNGKLAIS
ncbi:MAG: sugar nucleotide-binding protein [Pirellulales bacterium]|nr:sugar nucleotide-binding protein [Pirellulales bacterium]